MQWTKSSRPASGAEHQFSHLWDMEHHTHNGEAPSHGFKVGVATLAVTALYEELLKRPLEQIDVGRCLAGWPDAAETERRTRALFAGSDFVETAAVETLAKHVSHAELRIQLEGLRSAWSEMRARLGEQLVPYAELKRRLRLVGAPTGPEEIGLTRERLRGSFQRAYHIRRRFTALDLAVRAGVLDECLDSLFGPGGAYQQ
jgi:glycerol-1-phosphate dehydrogenase [NAD(P)+]